MTGLPERPPVGLPPLPAGWTEHKAPSGHTYYYNKEAKKSTYTRPVADIHTLHTSQLVPPAATYPSQPSAPYHAPAPAPYTAPAPHTSSAPYAPGTNTTYTPYNPNTFNTSLLQSTIPSLPHPHPFQRDAHAPHRGAHRSFPDRDRRRDTPNPRTASDRPKHRTDIPNCAPWVLVRTKLGRRFVWNKDTNESFWKFPADVLKAVTAFDIAEREKRERRERGEPSDVEDNGEDDAALLDMERELAAAEADVERQIVEVEGDVGMENESEYEEVEVTDDEAEGADGAEPSAKRQRTAEPGQQQDADQPMEMGDDDIAWQLAEMEALESGLYPPDDEDEDEGLPLTEEDCKALFKELLDDMRISPFLPWDNLLANDALYEDERYKALPTMKARKECFDEWARERIAIQREQKAQQQKTDPRIPYLAFLHSHATPKLYWPEFRRKFKKEAEMKDTKLPDKEKEKLYREHIKRLAQPPSTLKSDLSALLKAQPLSKLHRNSTLDTLPDAVLADLRFISLPPNTRDSLVETYISTLEPPAEDVDSQSEEQHAEAEKRRAERARREKALAERERRVEAERRRQERDLAYGKDRLRQEEDEIARAMRVGKGGLRAHLGD